ncbi:hypothetical protein QCA50_012959 [Cerrena zonata]|uniref:Uncharacterized protein n=1 Tax=Cerrena zonata TaxID=2478898 RepID=A0AAW0FSH6_9APHY
MSVSTDEFEDAISDQNLSMNNDNDNDATPSIQKANSPASTLNAHTAESIHSVETEQTIDSNVSSNSKKNKKKKNKKKNKKKQQEEQEEPEQGDQDDQAEDPLEEEEQKREGDEDVLQDTTIQLDRDGEAEEVKNDANGEIESTNPVSNEEEKLTVVVPKPIVNDEALKNENPEEDIPEVIDPQVPDQNSPVVDLDQNSEDAVKKNENTEGIIDSESPLKTNDEYHESAINEDRESLINENHQDSTDANHESPINDHDKTLNGDSKIKEEPIEKEVLVVDSPSKPQSDDDTKL